MQWSSSDHQSQSPDLEPPPPPRPRVFIRCRSRGLGKGEKKKILPCSFEQLDAPSWPWRFWEDRTRCVGVPAVPFPSSHGKYGVRLVGGGASKVVRSFVVGSVPFRSVLHMLSWGWAVLLAPEAQTDSPDSDSESEISSPLYCTVLYCTPLRCDEQRKPGSGNPSLVRRRCAHAPLTAAPRRAGEERVAWRPRLRRRPGPAGRPCVSVCDAHATTSRQHRPRRRRMAHQPRPERRVRSHGTASRRVGGEKRNEAQPRGRAGAERERETEPPATDGCKCRCRPHPHPSTAAKVPRPGRGESAKPEAARQRGWRDARALVPSRLRQDQPSKSSLSLLRVPFSSNNLLCCWCWFTLPS
jgi:hypothetical protein